MLQKGSSIPVPRGAPTYYLKCLVSNNKKKTTRHIQKQENVTHTLEKKAGHRNCLSERPDIRFIIKTLYSSHYDTFTETKELTIEVVNEDMIIPNREYQ